MKKKVLAYFSGVFATVLVLTMVTTALAASGKATFNFVNVSLRGEQKIAAGADITVANGQKVPSSILYTDEKGGKTNYLPIRAISELLGVEIKYDSATKTVQLEKQPTAVDAGALGQWSRSFEANMVWSSNISIIISAKANLRVALFPQINSGEEGYFPILPPDGTDFCCRSKITSAAGCRSSLRGKVDTEKINLSHSK